MNRALGWVLRATLTGFLLVRPVFGAIPESLLKKQEVRLLEEVNRSSTDPRLLELAAGTLTRLRLERAGDSSGPRRHEAHYLDALLLAKFSTIYDLLYDSQKRKAFESEVVGIKLSTLFDGFMEMIASGQVPEGMKSAEKQIGKCLAAKILEARPECQLDDETQDQPSTLRLAAMRASCGLLSSGCEIRRSFFAAAKPEIEKARNSPEVQKQIRDLFEKVFPERFRQGLLQEVANIRGNYGEWVAAKFNSPKAAFVSVDRPRLIQDSKAPMLIADEETVGQGWTHRMDGVAHGLLADLALARLGQRVIDSSPDSPKTFQAVSETAAAFWSSIQQLLVLTGGSRALFGDKSTGYALIEGDLKSLPPRFSKESPYLKGELFGGWSVSQIAGDDSALRFAPWDWEKYLALPSDKGSPISILPHAFKMDPQGRPQSIGPQSAVQTLEDQVALAEGINEFLEMTEQGGVFSRHLGSEEALAEIMDPVNPILLPRQARLLGYAIVAGIARNLTHPDFALVEKQATIEPGQGLGVKFFETASLETRERTPAKTTSLARLVMTAAKFRDRVAKDPEFPVKDRTEILGLIDTIVPIGALTLGAQAQNPDGSFRSVLNSADTGADLLSTVQALRAIQSAHLMTGMKVLTLNLKAGMESLKRQLPNPQTASDLGPEQRLAMWHFVLLWDQAKADWSEAIFGQEGKELRKQWEKALLESLN